MNMIYETNKKMDLNPIYNNWAKSVFGRFSYSTIENSSLYSLAEYFFNFYSNKLIYKDNH